MIAAKQYEDISYSGYYNVGPDDKDCVKTGELVDLFVKHWGEGLKWTDRSDGGPHEATFLKLDCTKLKNTFGWSPKWDIDKAVEKTVEWTRNRNLGGNVRELMDKQIREYIG